MVIINAYCNKERVVQVGQDDGCFLSQGLGLSCIQPIRYRYDPDLACHFNRVEGSTHHKLIPSHHFPILNHHRQIDTR